MTPLPLACSADAPYLPHAAAMMRSALWQQPELEIHYLHGADVGRAARDQLRLMVEEAGGTLVTHEVKPDRVAGMRAWDYISAGMWRKVFLPELLPGADRVLSLDADTVVMDSLRPLAELDLGDHYVAAVENVFMPEHAGIPAALGLAPERGYFNSGVMLLNLEAMRRDRCQEALIDIARNPQAHGISHDQDALNLVLGARRRRLPPRWNCMNSVLVFPWANTIFDEAELLEARRSPAIRHFEGPGVAKPWHYLFEFPHRDAYLAARRGTPWPRVRREGRTAGNVAVRVARRLRRAPPWPPPGVA